MPLLAISLLPFVRFLFLLGEDGKAGMGIMAGDEDVLGVEEDMGRGGVRCECRGLRLASGREHEFKRCDCNDAGERMDSANGDCRAIGGNIRIDITPIRGEVFDKPLGEVLEGKGRGDTSTASA